MKKLTTLLIMMLLSNLSFAQSLNDKLYKAVSDKDTLMVDQLLQKGADAHYQKKSGGFFVMSMLILSAQKGDYKSTQLLVDHKAEVDWKDAFNSTALMYAAAIGDKRIVLYLISKGANVNADD